VLQRGEKLDNLVERSEALSAQSKMFYKTAKKVLSSSSHHSNPTTHLSHVTAKLVLRHYVAPVQFAILGFLFFSLLACSSAWRLEL
jgi:hypothetical protein